MGAIMLNRGKPIRFGYKLWALCESNSYSFHLQINHAEEPGKSPHPLGSGVINDLTNIVCVQSAAKLHRLYFDNFFSSYTLPGDLTKNEKFATGTIRETRTNGAAGLMNVLKQNSDRYSMRMLGH